MNILAISITPIIPNIRAIGSHSGLVTHHQLQSIFPVNLSVKNTTNITVSILELTRDMFDLGFVSLITNGSFHLPIFS